MAIIYVQSDMNLFLKEKLHSTPFHQSRLTKMKVSFLFLLVTHKKASQGFIASIGNKFSLTFQHTLPITLESVTKKRE